MRKLAAILRAVGRLEADASLLVLLPNLQDVLVFGGLAAASFGVHQVYAPAGWILAGAGCFWLGVRKV